MEPPRIELEGERILLISPHCDDGVFSCAHLLMTHPNSVVATVFAGRPPAGQPLTEWDRAAGFQPGDDVIGLRRAEDLDALVILGAYPLWLDFCDSQYQQPPSGEDVALALREVLRVMQPAAVFLPLGLFHRDHLLAHEAGLQVRREAAAPVWLLYEDAIYRRLPGLVEERLRRLGEAAIRLSPVSFPEGDPLRKRDAVGCYRSQVRALCQPGGPGYADALTPERYWLVEA